MIVDKIAKEVTNGVWIAVDGGGVSIFSKDPYPGGIQNKFFTDKFWLNTLYDKSFTDFEFEVLEHLVDHEHIQPFTVFVDACGEWKKSFIEIQNLVDMVKRL